MRRHGFNLLPFFSSDRRERAPQPKAPDLKALDWLARRGFDFVRLPCDYRWWMSADDGYQRQDEAVLGLLDAWVAACAERGLHCCLNLHRAPGYCINRPEIERHNLWTEVVAQDAFVAQWERFARRYAAIAPDRLSFDLVNEPPNVGDRGCTRDVHAAVMRRVAAAIRALTPARTIVIDGLGGGNVPMPELADLGAIQSARGYAPYSVTHAGADWCGPAMEAFRDPQYPGVDKDGMWWWDRDTLRVWYRSWRELEKLGVTVHVGEFGCFNRTPHDVALRWLADLLAVWRENGWGWAMWNFEGPFGIVDHGRPGARMEDVDGYRVDRDMLDLLLAAKE